MPPINFYCTATALPPIPGGQPLALRDRSDPEMADHLRGFEGYLMQASGGKRTSTLFAAVQAVKHVRHQVSSEDWSPQWTGFGNAALAILFFPDGTIRDPQQRVLIGPDADPEAQVPHPQDAVAHLSSARAWMETRGLRVPESLTPGLGEAQVAPREPAEVFWRAIALIGVASRADTYAHGGAAPLDAIESRFGTLRLSPREQAFITATEPASKGMFRKLLGRSPDAVDPRELNLFTWRYEAAAMLLWAVGLWELSEQPDAQVSVEEMVLSLLQRPLGELAAGAQLRPLSELLAAQARVRSAHWAVRQAMQISGGESPQGFNPGVVAERHTAANWLTRQWAESWDAVDTPS